MVIGTPIDFPVNQDMNKAWGFSVLAQTHISLIEYPSACRQVRPCKYFKEAPPKTFFALLQISMDRKVPSWRQCPDSQSTKLGIALPRKFFSLSYWVRIRLGLERRLFMSIKWALCFLGALCTTFNAGNEQRVYL